MLLCGVATCRRDEVIPKACAWFTGEALYDVSCLLAAAARVLALRACVAPLTALALWEAVACWWVPPACAMQRLSF